MEYLEYLVNESIKTYMNNIIKESSYTKKVQSVEELFNITTEKKDDVVMRMQIALNQVNDLFNRIINVAQRLHEEIVSKYNIQPNQISCSIDLDEYTIVYFINGSEAWSEEEFYNQDSEVFDMLNTYMPRNEFSNKPLRDFFSVHLEPADGNYRAIGNENGYKGAIITVSWDIYDLVRNDDE